MKGETTLDERIVSRLAGLELVRTFYKSHYSGLDSDKADEYLIAQLIADATYLACYYGIDLETLIEENVNSTRSYFPDIPG